jgi:hypothetical protein
MNTIVEKLDRVYCCKRCSAVFLFKSDVDDHREMSGHGDVKEMPFS